LSVIALTTLSHHKFPVEKLQITHAFFIFNLLKYKVFSILFQIEIPRVIHMHEYLYRQLNETWFYPSNIGMAVIEGSR